MPAPGIIGSESDESHPGIVAGGEHPVGEVSRLRGHNDDIRSHRPDEGRKLERTGAAGNNVVPVSHGIVRHAVFKRDG